MSVSRQVHNHLFWIVHAQVRRHAVIALRPLADAQVDRGLWADNYTKGANKTYSSRTCVRRLLRADRDLTRRQ